jgi:hypothetical protein
MKTAAAITLVSSLREEMRYDMFFTQACLNASEEDQSALSRIVLLARNLRSNKQSEADRAAHEHIKAVQRGMTGQKKHELRRAVGRVFKVQPTG